jgi:hypothetical protein
MAYYTQSNFALLNTQHLYQSVVHISLLHVWWYSEGECCSTLSTITWINTILWSVPSYNISTRAVVQNFLIKEMSAYRNVSVITQFCWEVGVGGKNLIDIAAHSLQSRNRVLCKKCHTTELTYSFRTARLTIPTADKTHQTIHTLLD